MIGKITDQETFDAVQRYPFVQYIGYVNKEELIKHYRDNHIFLLPSHYETFGLVYAEALSQGLPIIFTRGQGFDGQINEYTVGFAVDPNDIYHISVMLKNIINNYDEISINTTAAAMNFKWDNIVNKYLNTFTIDWQR